MRQPVQPSSIDRLPPNALDAEIAVIGSILLDPVTAIPVVVEASSKLSDAPLFYDLRNQAVLEVLVEMQDKLIPINIVTVVQILQDREQLAAAGGYEYLNACMDATPSAAAVDYYLAVLLDKALKRRLIQSCTGTVTKVYESADEPVDKVLDEAEREIFAINLARSPDNIKTVKASVHTALEEIERQQHQQGVIEGLTTGFIDLDKMLAGLKGGDYFVIAARPSMGKTSLALNIVEHVALDLKLPIGFFSLEMAQDAIIKRMLASRSRINLRHVLGGFLAERDYPKLAGAAVKIAAAPIHICDASELSILQVRSKARQWKHKHDIRLLVLDYLQLVSGVGTEKSREQEVSNVSKGLKSLAKDIQIPVLVLAQLNRASDKGNERPRLSHLRESGSIEQDADIVGLLFSQDEEEARMNGGEVMNVTLEIAKQRNGPTGDVPLTFFKTFTRFESAAKVNFEEPGLL